MKYDDEITLDDTPKRPEVKPQTIVVQDNPYKKWIYLAQVIDSWRIFPRIFLTVYVVILYQVVNWFMLLESPNFEQSTLVSVVIGAGAAWFGIYTNSAPRIDKE